MPPTCAMRRLTALFGDSDTRNDDASSAELYTATSFGSDEQ
jgi:hypothetical protein